MKTKSDESWKETTDLPSRSAGMQRRLVGINPSRICLLRENGPLQKAWFLRFFLPGDEFESFEPEDA
jgi:hypothetical protein